MPACINSKRYRRVESKSEWRFSRCSTGHVEYVYNNVYKHQWGHTIRITLQLTFASSQSVRSSTSIHTIVILPTVKVYNIYILFQNRSQVFQAWTSEYLNPIKIAFTILWLCKYQSQQNKMKSDLQWNKENPLYLTTTTKLSRFKSVFFF